MIDYKRSHTNRIFASLTAIAVFVSLLLGIFIKMDVVVFAEGGTPEVEAISALLIDARRGQVIYSKSSDEPVKTPVVNKLMTALIALDKAEPEALVTASNEAVGVEGAVLDLTVGEKYSVRSLIFATVLLGANDAVKALSEYVGGGETGFVKLMNDYAQKTGMTNTRFTNTIGSFDENQYTTANDIGVFLRYALSSNTEFIKILSTQAKPWYDNEKTVLMKNANNMFFNYEGTDGGILGGDGTKLKTIITTATRNSMRLICVLTDVADDKMYPNTISLFNYGFDNYRFGTLVAAGSIQKTVTVEDEPVNLIPTSDVHYIYPRGQNYVKNINISVDPDKLKPPVTKNSVVGIATFTLMDETIINVDLYPDKEILPKKTKTQILKERLEESKELIYVIAGLIIIELILLLSKAFGYINKQIIKKRAKRSRLH